MKTLIALALLLALPQTAWADFPEVKAVTAGQSGAGWHFSVTLSHPDSGWEHYADGWEVLSPDGTSLGLRVLAHPHVNEQPFRRALSGVVIPDGLTQAFIRARCIRDGWSADLFAVDLER